MGEIINFEKGEEKEVILKVKLTHEEFIKLGGHIDNIHLFSEDMEGKNTVILEKGRKYMAKYISIPRELKEKSIDYKHTACKIIRVPSETKVIYVTIMDKLKI